MGKHTVKKGEYIHVILCLLAVAIMPIYLYGIAVLYIILSAVATGIVADFICLRFNHKKHFVKHDYSFIITSLVVALLLPATVPLWVPVVAVSIAIVIAKYPFGGNGYNIFNPAAVGLAFTAICWPQYVLRYPTPGQMIDKIDPALVLFSESTSSILHVGGTPKTEYFDVFLGKFAGPMGATCIIVLACCLLYLVLNRVASLKVILPALAVIGVIAVVLPRVTTGRWSSLIFEGSAGALVFGLIFMTSDPVTTPRTTSGRILYGLILGSIVVVFRWFGQVELEFVYAILIANIFAIPCDRYAHYLTGKMEKMFAHKRRRKQIQVARASDPEIIHEETINNI